MKAPDLFKQYLWMADTFYHSNGMTLQEFNERWIQTDMSGGLPMIRQTFNRNRQTIQEMLGISIKCRIKGGYHYYIDGKEDLKLHSFKSWMLDSLSINNTLMHCKALKDRLLMEHIPSGTEYFQRIVRAMNENLKIRITYHRFEHEAYTITVDPYAIKVFKQRWYLLAKNYKRESPTVYALDRMESVEVLTEKFQFPSDFSAEVFFQHCYGVICDPKVKPQQIVLRAYPPLMHYLRTLPLHHSQKELASTPEYVDFELYLSPTFDFKQELLAQAKDVEVLKPSSLREEMQRMMVEIMERYKR